MIYKDKFTFSWARFLLGTFPMWMMFFLALGWIIFSGRASKSILGTMWLILSVLVFFSFRWYSIKKIGIESSDHLSKDDLLNGLIGSGVTFVIWVLITVTVLLVIAFAPLP